MSDLNVVKEMLQGKELSSMSLDELARVIRKDWKKVYFGAVPYLEALSGIDSNGMFMNDPWQSIVAYFLGNANTWKGPVAKEVKAELKKRLKKNKMARLQKLATSLRKIANTKFVIKDEESFSQLLPRLEKLVKSLSKDALMGNARVHVSGGSDEYITRKAVGYLENNGILVGWDDPKSKKGSSHE